MSDTIVTGTDFVMLPTQNFEAAAAFHRDTLGLDQSARYGGIDGGEFETGTLTIQVMDTTNLPIDFSPTPNPLALHVDDFEGAKAELASRGVEFLGHDIDSGVCNMAFFRDPDGNALMIHHRYAPKD
jgi:catechol 2,3-dioxygenase-like lactoylglutathione lyase family enzyme